MAGQLCECVNPMVDGAARPWVCSKCLGEVRARAAAGVNRPGKSYLVRLVWARFAGVTPFPFVPEFYFDKRRKWRFDWAHEETTIAVEVEGVVTAGRSRHQVAGGYEADAEKYNRAALLGWLVLRYSQRQLQDFGGAARAFEEMLLAGRLRRGVRLDVPAWVRRIEESNADRSGAWLPPPSIPLERQIELLAGEWKGAGDET